MRYSIIYADPPWSYRDRAVAGKRGACFKYSTLTTTELCALKVASIVANDSALLLWATSPLLPDALRVMEAWGFNYKTLAFVWVKANRKSRGFFWGMGNWTRANAEIVLIGIRGKPKRLLASVHQIVYARVMEHSRKPAIVRDRIVQLLGDLPRVELFAREKLDGWEAIGFELDGKDIRETLK